MFGTVESIHLKICEKFKLLSASHHEITIAVDKLLLKCVDVGKKASKYDEWRQCITGQKLISQCAEIETIMKEYNLGVASSLCMYYTSSPGRINNEDRKATKNYYRAITTMNIQGRIIVLTNKLARSATAIAKLHISVRVLEQCAAKLIQSLHTPVDVPLEKQNWEQCKCGGRMQIIPEVSERRCTNPECCRIKSIIGAVFRDEQFYLADGQKTKQGGYDTGRHYKFWIERLQALEQKEFPDEKITAITRCIKNDRYVPQELTCEIMRKILKDPSVNATKLNDHAALLVKMFGGRPPPQLTSSEHRTCSVRFNRAMKLYDQVNDGDDGNKPYYPYFIYKILEEMFKNNPEKLRLIDYVHLQSRETVTKNDKDFRQMCDLADPEDGLVYTPTNPAGRM